MSPIWKNRRGAKKAADEIPSAPAARGAEAVAQNGATATESVADPAATRSEGALVAASRAAGTQEGSAANGGLDASAAAPAPAHLVRHLSHDCPPRLAPGEVIPIRLVIENAGTLAWQSSSPRGDHVGLAVHWDGRVVANHTLPRPEVRPGEQVSLRFALEAPTVPGRHELSLELVQYQVTVFSDRGSPKLVIAVEIADEAPSETARLWTTSQAVGPWHYLPTRGISRAKDGTSYPVFARRAQGCHLWDQDERRYVDYTMGWGTMLLGYAHPAVTEAMREAVSSGAVTAWPQPVEVELGRMLTEDFPCAEMVCFAKNGSDACTFAARMARVFTGRKQILFTGYHGWQDFWAEQVGFERTGVPAREPALIHRFPFHDPKAFLALYEEHKDDLAAVFVEPSPWAGDGSGFEPDTDVEFLRLLADKTRRAGALLVFDEIVTGYRYPGHSVHAAKKVIPDLCCLGKAIAAGMPLSAVVGRADVFKAALPRTFYAATFHGEAWSFAAAKAAIGVYRREPVARHVWDYGVRLKNLIERLAREAGLPARMWGPPFRMNLRFEPKEQALVPLERTLMQQELLKAGVTTYNGVMLPCYAHDEEAFAATAEAFARAFDVVARAERAGSWDEALEIPLLIDL